MSFVHLSLFLLVVAAPVIRQIRLRGKWLFSQSFGKEYTSLSGNVVSWIQAASTFLSVGPVCPCFRKQLLLRIIRVSDYSIEYPTQVNPSLLQKVTVSILGYFGDKIEGKSLT